MNKPTVLLLAVALLGGCAANTGSPPTAVPTDRATSAPVATAPSTTSASPATSTNPAGCIAVGPDDAPDLVLHTAAGTDRSGLNSTVPGSETDAWHQPDPATAVVVGRGERLSVDAFTDTTTPLCIGSISVDAAPFAATATQPIGAMIQALPADPIAAPNAAIANLAAPSADGEWVVRVVLGLAAADGSARLERRFWRLRIGVDAPTAGGMPSRSGTCIQPGTAAPTVALRTLGGSMAGQSGSSTWRGTSADAGDEPNGTTVDATPSTHLKLAVEGSVCAAGWRIVLAPLPLERGGARLPLEPFQDLVAPRAAADVAGPVSADEFSLGTLPVGDWVLRASFEFTDTSGSLVGQTTSYWNMIVR